METLRFATFLAPAMHPVYEYIAEYAARKLHISTTLFVGKTFDQFAKGEADVGFICGLPYVNLRDETPPPVELLAAPVLSPARYSDQPIYFSDVIVRADSKFHTFADLRGARWAYNDPDSHSGWNVVRHKLALVGGEQGYFSSIIESGAHQRSIRLVCAGEVDASAIDTQVLAVELREHPELAPHLRVIDTLGPSPIQPVVANVRLPESLRADLRAVLLGMGDDEAAREKLAFGQVRRFAPVTDSDYDPIREMRALAQNVSFAPDKPSP